MTRKISNAAAQQELGRRKSAPLGDMEAGWERRMLASCWVARRWRASASAGSTGFKKLEKMMVSADLGRWIRCLKRGTCPWGAPNYRDDLGIVSHERHGS
jgi:hypothetical protein